MKQLNVIAIVTAVLVLVWSARFVAAEEPAASKGGSVSGTVLKDGKPVANARVGLMIAPVKAKVKGLSKHSAPATQPAAGEARQKHGRHDLAAQASTDADGKFTLENISPGEYVVMAGGKGQGRGKVHVNVAAGESASVSIDLQAPKDKAKKPNKLGL